MATRTNTARSRPAFVNARSKVFTAKCEINQPLVDTIAEKRERMATSNFSYTLRRAMESICQSRTPITTYEEAIALQYIGPGIASLLFQKEVPAKKPSRKRTKAEAAEDDESVRSPSTSKATTNARSKSAKEPDSTMAAPSSKLNSVLQRPQKHQLQNLLRTQPEEAPSRKEVAYQKAVQEAESYKGKHLIWRLVLLIDRRERKAEHYSSKIQQCGIPTEIRNLPIGDMTWIAQGCSPSGDKVHAELLLGTIIERKEVSDLKSSLFGTRYNEQQLRLKESGQPQVIFLIEGDLKKDLYRCPADTLHSTLWAIRIDKGNQVIQTNHIEDTVNTLRRMHRRMLKRTFPTAFYGGGEALPSFAGPEAGGSRNNSRKRDSFGEQRKKRRRRLESLHGLTFDEEPIPMAGMERFTTYKELCAKVERDRESGRRTVGGIHQAMLKQVATVSDSKIPAICEVHPTISSLLQAYGTVGDHEVRKTLLQSIPLHNPGVVEKTAAAGSRTLGARSAAELYIAYGLDGDSEEEDASGLRTSRPKYTDLVRTALDNQKQLPPSDDGQEDNILQQANTSTLSEQHSFSSSASSLPAERNFSDEVNLKKNASASVRSSPDNSTDGPTQSKPARPIHKPSATQATSVRIFQTSQLSDSEEEDDTLQKAIAASLAEQQSPSSRSTNLHGNRIFGEEAHLKLALSASFSLRPSPDTSTDGAAALSGHDTFNKHAGLPPREAVKTAFGKTSIDLDMSLDSTDDELMYCTGLTRKTGSAKDTQEVIEID